MIFHFNDAIKDAFGMITSLIPYHDDCKWQYYYSWLIDEQWNYKLTI